jgi:hypothetical protein
MIGIRHVLAVLVVGLVNACTLTLDTNVLNEGCPDGTKPCNDQCVSKRLPQYGCGNPSCIPCVLAQAKSNCNENFECAIAACAPRFLSCDGRDDNGCEVNINESQTQCGSNCIDCTKQNVANVTEARCGAGRCYALTCDANWRDCDGTFLTGCEYPVSNLQTDPNNCGTCKNVCATSQSCANGICQ